jgi:2-methylcitrate dehydratase
VNVGTQAAIAGTTPTVAEQIGRFVAEARFEDIPADALDRLKRNLLDSFACALGALAGPPIARLRNQVERFGGNPIASLVGGGWTAPDRAAAYNTALTRYLDFMDSFMTKGETCHPSDNTGSVLAAAESAGRNGRELLTALATAYEVECRLTEAIPIMHAGFDHTTQLGISIAAGVARALDADNDRTANAIAIAASDFASLAIIRASPTSEWKGLASSALAFAVVHSTFLAVDGTTGPLAVFEGPRGFFEAVGDGADVDWHDRTLDAVLDTSLKKYNAEVHTQTALDALLELLAAHRLAAENIESIDIEVFLTAYDIVGGGAYGDRTTVETKEQADHSLPYLAAVAILDGEVMPEQFRPERIPMADVQSLLRRVSIRPHGRIARPRELSERIDSYSRVYPDEMPATVSIKLRDGRTVSIERRSYEGFHDNPMSWSRIEAKLERLAEHALTPSERRALVDGVHSLETIELDEITELLRAARLP